MTSDFRQWHRRGVSSASRGIFVRTAVVALVAASAPALFGNLLGVDFYDHRFGVLNDVTGAYTQISNLPISSAAAGIAALNGLYYLEDFGNNLFSVDPLTGTASLVGSTRRNLSAAAFAGTGSGLYEIDQSSNLYSINSATGAATEIGPTGIAPANGAYDTSLSATATELFYTAGRGGQNDELYEISPVTGIAIDLGSTGVAGVAGSALVNGELELFQYGRGTNYIYTTSVASLAPGSVHFTQGAQLDAAAQILDGGASLTVSGAGAAVNGSTPEPATFALAGIGLTVGAVAGARRRRRTSR